MATTHERIESAWGNLSVDYAGLEDVLRQILREYYENVDNRIIAKRKSPYLTLDLIDEAIAAFTGRGQVATLGDEVK